MAGTSRTGQWDKVARSLEEANRGIETDQLIDAAACAAIEAPTPSALPALLRANSVASGQLTKKSVALAIALCAVPGTLAYVDVLVAAFRDARGDAFLAPATLDALFVLACRDALARTELSSLLQRVAKSDNCFVVAKAATTCGRLLQLGWCSELRQKLVEFSEAADESAAMEAHFQLACVEMHGINSADDRLALLEAIRKSSLAFRSAEPRPDAYAMRQFLDLFLAFAELTENASREDKVSATRDALLQWPGYESPQLTLFIEGATRAIDALVAAKKAAEEACGWLDIREGLLELARAIGSLTHSNLGGAFALLGSDLTTIGQTIVHPRVGNVLSCAIGHKRIELAIREADTRDGPESAMLRDLAAVLDLADSELQVRRRNATEFLDRISQATGQSPDAILCGLDDAIGSGNIKPWIESVIPGRVRLPIYDRGLYGTDPTVHFAVCRLLEELQELLAPYERACWDHLRRVVGSALQFIQFVRDDLSDYCLCQEDGGKGQSASETDLQVDLFRWLRQNFGNQSVYEAGPVAGGRTDSGLRFDDAEFPIEVKHEFHHVDRQHVRDNYILQPSVYASVRQRVSFLFILDLRTDNSAGHTAKATAARKANQPSFIRSLYSLSDSFWAESLPVDPEIHDCRESVVVVLLVPGNRPKPSSQTRYSQRPQAARMAAKKQIET